MPKRILSIVFVVVCFSTAAPGALAHSNRANAVTTWQTHTISNLEKRALYLERVMHHPAVGMYPSAKRRLASASTPRQRARVLIDVWEGVYRRVAAQYRRPPLLSALMCIHNGEGTWHDQRNPIYDGGLQMNYGFQARYGWFLLRLKGRAYNWTPLEQIWTAVYAITGPDHRGFYPWPMTARACGLI